MNALWPTSIRTTQLQLGQSYGNTRCREVGLKIWPNIAIVWTQQNIVQIRNGDISLGMYYNCNLSPLYPYEKKFQAEHQQNFGDFIHWINIWLHLFSDSFSVISPVTTSSHVYTPPASLVIRQWPILCENAPSYCNITGGTVFSHAFVAPSDHHDIPLDDSLNLSTISLSNLKALSPATRTPNLWWVNSSGSPTEC